MMKERSTLLIGAFYITAFGALFGLLGFEEFYLKFGQALTLAAASSFICGCILIFSVFKAAQIPVDGLYFFLIVFLSVVLGMLLALPGIILHSVISRMMWE